MKTLEVWYGVPPDREDPVVQLFFAGTGPQWGEITRVEGKLKLEVFPNQEGRSWMLPVEELQEVLRRASERLGDQP